MTKLDKADLLVLRNAIRALEAVKDAGLSNVHTRKAIGALRYSEFDIIDSERNRV